MRVKHKTLAVWGLLALMLVVAMMAVACGGTEEETTTTAGEEGTSTTVALAEGEFTIGITQIVAHPALDATAQGFKDALADAGYVEGQNVTYDMQDAQGEPANATLIAQKFVGDNVDMIFAIATPTAQAAVNETTEIPIVFGAVTDPVSAELVTNAEAPEANVTGASDKLPLQPHLDLIKALVPEVKTIGLIYNAGEANSVALVEEEKTLAAAMGIEVVEATAANTAEVLAAAQSLVGRVDAVSVLTDNTVVEAFESVVQVCEENKIPLIAGDIDSVERGAIAAYAFDYYDHGYQAGQMAVKVLQGTPISEIPVEYAQDLKLAINEAAAEAMGVTIPDDLLSKADEKF